MRQLGVVVCLVCAFPQAADALPGASSMDEARGKRARNRRDMEVVAAFVKRFVNQANGHWCKAKTWGYETYGHNGNLEQADHVWATQQIAYLAATTFLLVSRKSRYCLLTTLASSKSIHHLLGKLE